MSDGDFIDIERALEAILFASEKPLSFPELQRKFPDETNLRPALENLIDFYAQRGVELKRIGDSYAFRTAPDMAEYLSKEITSERKLSRAAMETLAIIAYHEPTTRAEIEEIRGVAVSKGTLDQLLALEWIKLGKRRETPGRPITFLTTTHFLDHFGLSSTRDLPGIAELRESGLLNRRIEEDEARSGEAPEEGEHVDNHREFEGDYDDDFEEVIDTEDEFD